MYHLIQLANQFLIVKMEPNGMEQLTHATVPSDNTCSTQSAIHAPLTQLGTAPTATVFQVFNSWPVSAQPAHPIHNGTVYPASVRWDIT